MDLSIAEQLEIVRMCGVREVWNTICLSIAAVFSLAGIVCLLRPMICKALDKIRRIGIIRTAILSIFVIPAIIYGGSKRTATINNFKAAECPDSVTYTWDEVVESNVVINAVQVERRLLGATEEEAWELHGSPVSGGVKHLTIDGFTLDKDYEYRVRYIYTTEGN